MVVFKRSEHHWAEVWNADTHHEAVEFVRLVVAEAKDPSIVQKFVLLSCPETLRFRMAKRQVLAKYNERLDGFTHDQRNNWLTWLWERASDKARMPFNTNPRIDEVADFVKAGVVAVLDDVVRVPDAVDVQCGCKAVGL